MKAQSVERLRAKYRLGEDDLLGKGMEAEAYAYGDGQVLKIYTNDITAEHLYTLQAFYAGLDTSSLSYQLPRIHQVWEEEGRVLSLEQRLPGTVLSAKLPGLAERELEAVFDHYVEAILELRQVRFPAEFPRYKLFDLEGLSLRSEGDFNAFLLRYLQHRLNSCEAYLRRDVADWDGKLERLRTLLGQPYTGEYALVHGDFFLGNLLMDEHHRITALLDFGWMTHYGDPLYDLATGWVFFDMYDELKRDIRQRLGRVIWQAVGEETLGLLHRYILLYMRILVEIGQCYRMKLGTGFRAKWAAVSARVSTPV